MQRKEESQYHLFQGPRPSSSLALLPNPRIDFTALFLNLCFFFFFLTALQNLYTSESFQVYRKVAKIIQRVSYIYQNFKIHTGTLLLIKLQTSPGFPQVPPRPPKHPLSVPGSHAGNPLHLVMTLPWSPLIWDTVSVFPRFPCPRQVLRSTGQAFCRPSLGLGSFDAFLINHDWSYGSEERRPQRRGALLVTPYLGCILSVSSLVKAASIMWLRWSGLFLHCILWLQITKSRSHSEKSTPPAGGT